MARIVLSVLTIVGFICGIDCQVTAWTNPNIATIDGTGSLTPTVAENTAVGTLGVTVAATGATNYVITAQPTAGKITLDASTGVLSLAAGQSVDFEAAATYLLTIEGDDGSGSTGTITATLAITDVDESPVFSLSTVSVTVANKAAAGTSVSTVTATDPEAASVTYSITGGNTNTDFAIDSASGAITTVNVIDYGTTASYDLIVEGTDGTSTAATATVSVAIGGITSWTNPVIAAADGNGALTPTVAENTAAGALGVTVTAVTATNYVITSQPTTGKITIDASNGALSLAAGQSLDFEAAATYILAITANGGGTTASVTATLSITNVNEAPTFSQSAYSVSVADEAAVDTTVTTLTATDPESDAITYAIAGGNTNTDFSIDSSTGLIKVVNVLDQTTTSSYTLTVTGTDPGSNAGTATVSISFNTASVNAACAGLIVIMAIMMQFVLK